MSSEAKKVGRPSGVRTEYAIRRDLEHSQRQVERLSQRIAQVKSLLSDLELKLLFHSENVSELQSSIPTEEKAA